LTHKIKYRFSRLSEAKGSEEPIQLISKRRDRGVMRDE